MNAGGDYTKAKAHAQANANRSGQSWSMCFYGGVWWIEQCREDDPVRNDLILVRPEGRHA